MNKSEKQHDGGAIKDNNIIYLWLCRSWNVSSISFMLTLN